MDRFIEKEKLGRSSSNASSLSGKERSRWPPLSRMLMSGEVTDEPWREMTWKENFDVWMINEGWRRLFVGVFVLLHAMVFAFGFMNYYLKVTTSVYLGPLRADLF
jgi:hypothetical protein